jgi:hypothetical protein
MLDTTPLLLTVPNAGFRSVIVPLTNPAESQEVQIAATYVGTGGTAGTDVLTMTGVGGVGSSVIGVCAGVAFSYPSVVGDSTLTLLATNLAAYLNTFPSIKGLGAITSGVGTVTFTANVVGTAANTLPFSASSTGAILTATWATPSPTNGAAATVSGTTGLTGSMLVSYNNGATFVATNAGTWTVPASVVSSAPAVASKIYNQNNPQRTDAATVTHVMVTAQNLDATYAAIVAVSVERAV